MECYLCQVMTPKRLYCPGCVRQRLTLHEKELEPLLERKRVLFDKATDALKEPAYVDWRNQIVERDSLRKKLENSQNIVTAERKRLQEDSVRNASLRLSLQTRRQNLEAALSVLSQSVKDYQQLHQEQVQTMKDRWDKTYNVMVRSRRILVKELVTLFDVRCKVTAIFRSERPQSELASSALRISTVQSAKGRALENAPPSAILNDSQMFSYCPPRSKMQPARVVKNSDDALNFNVQQDLDQQKDRDRQAAPNSRPISNTVSQRLQTSQTTTDALSSLRFPEDSQQDVGLENLKRQAFQALTSDQDSASGRVVSTLSRRRSFVEDGDALRPDYRYEFSIVGLRLPQNWDCNSVGARSKSVRDPLNAAIGHVIQLTNLMAFYLGIKLPFRIINKGNRSIARGGGWEGRNIKMPLYLPDIDITEGEGKMTTSSVAAPVCPSWFTSFRYGVAMLAYDVLYLCHTQNVHVAFSMGDAPAKIDLVGWLAKGRDSMDLGRKSHSICQNHISDQSFPIDFQNVVAAVFGRAPSTPTFSLPPPPFAERYNRWGTNFEDSDDDRNSEDSEDDDDDVSIDEDYEGVKVSNETRPVPISTTNTTGSDSDLGWDIVYTTRNPEFPSTDDHLEEPRGGKETEVRREEGLRKKEQRREKSRRRRLHATKERLRETEGFSWMVREAFESVLGRDFG